jgi:hypothetical protein
MKTIVYGYNETDLDRWNESKTKSTVNKDGTDHDGAELNISGLAGGSDNDGEGGALDLNAFAGASDDENDDGGNGGNSINIKDKGYTISFGGGKRKKTRKRSKRISRNKTMRRHKI